MGRRLQAWGNQDLQSNSYVIAGPLGIALHGLTDPPDAWKSVPELLSKTDDAAAAKIARVQYLLDTKTGLPDDEQWHSRRPVGAGGYGVAALFEKVDENGQVVDELVIKTARTNVNLAISRERWTIPQEARIMSQFNQMDNEAILYLRALRTIVTPNERGGFDANGQIWRYYLEAAPCGDLERLRIRYKAWGCYLPEPFLWHIFKGLMEAAETMETGPFYHLHKFGEPFPNSYVVHCDIKPENIFLGMEKGDDGPASEFYYFPNYPVPKIADFGLARLTAYSDNDNHPRGFFRGTRQYYAPEVRIDRLPYWDGWKYRPFIRAPRESNRTRVDSWFAQHRITAAANVWAIGMVMYQLVTLDEPYELDNMVEQMTEDRFRIQGGRVLRSVATQQNPDYDQALLELILSCLEMGPEKRPTPERALETINGWLQGYRENVQLDLSLQDGPKVFYKANEINDMHRGDYDFDTSDRWWRRFFNRHEVWLDEHWGRLRPPRRPEHLDPWPREEHARDEESERMVPDSARQRARVTMQ